MAYCKIFITQGVNRQLLHNPFKYDMKCHVETHSLTSLGLKRVTSVLDVSVIAMEVFHVSLIAIGQKFCEQNLVLLATQMDW